MLHASFPGPAPAAQPRRQRQALAEDEACQSKAIVDAPDIAPPPNVETAPELEQQPPDGTGTVSARSLASSDRFDCRANAVERINALGDLAGGIAHDFRNVLAVIASALSLAQQHRGEPEKQQRFLGAAQEGTDRGLKLTTRLLALARPHPPDLHAENPARLISDLLPFLRYGAGAQARIELDLDRADVCCFVDPSQFNLALLNLVVNARDAMPGGGRILIRTRALGSEPGGKTPPLLRLEVTDSGEGMSAETVERIFDPWFTTKGETGTGLGLPQVRRFMELVGGTIAVATTPGLGTTFELLFPIGAAEATDAALPATSILPVAAERHGLAPVTRS